MDIRLDGQAAIVTGAASGIGLGIAEGLAESGAAVALADIRGEAAREAAESVAKKTGAKTLAVTVDVTDEEDVERAVSEVLEHFGEKLGRRRLDILVNCAGIAPPGALVDFPLDAWQKALAVNLTGYFLMARAAARVMVEQSSGCIVNISSKSGVRGSAAHSAYNATKWGEIGLGQGWARELARHNVRVNSVCPGNVLHGSGIWSDDYKAELAKKLGIRPDEVEESYTRRVPLGRACTVEDVANVVVFLVSDKASYVTGCTHLVDGGQEMR